jgi:catechol 2,3-dioxygenase-like lactoylglutathione lyase family enzyme
MNIGTKTLCHIAILVKDLDKAVKNWETITGVKATAVQTIPSSDKVPVFTNGKLDDCDDVKLANIELDNGVIIELAQPGKISNAYKDKLDRDGEGVQHIAFVVPDRKKAMKSLEEIGAPKPYHIGYWPGGTYSFTDSVKELGVEVNIKTDDDNTKKHDKLLSDPNFHKQDL